MPRKNGKTFLFACLALYEAIMGEAGGEVYFVAGDRQQASRAFDEVRRIVEQDEELSARMVMYRLHMEVPETGTILRVLSSEVGLQMGLSPSFVLFDEVAVQPTDKLWTTMSLGSAAREEPMLVGISTPGWMKDSLAYRLYEHGKRVNSGEEKDPTFFFACWEPSDPECDHTDPKVWRECNPALTTRREEGFVSEDDFKAAIPITPEHEFRRFRLGQWTDTKDAAFPAGAWSSCLLEHRVVRKGEEVVLGFDGSRERDCTALIGCTMDGYLFPIEIYEASEGQRVDPKNMALAIQQSVAYYNVRALVADETLWTWVLLELADSEAIPVLAFPQNNFRYVKAWAKFSDAVMEKRLHHDGDLTLARHVANLVLKSDRFGIRAVRDRTSPGSYIDAAMASQFAYSHVVDLNTAPIEVEQSFFAGRR